MSEAYGSEGDISKQKDSGVYRTDCDISKQKDGGVYSAEGDIAKRRDSRFYDIPIVLQYLYQPSPNWLLRENDPVYAQSIELKLSDFSSDAVTDLYAHLETQKQEVRKTIQELRQNHQASEEEKQKLQKQLEEIKQNQELTYVIEKLSDTGKNAVLEQSDLRSKFLHQGSCDSFVMSVDIRRSTELMLKARTPDYFATFISVLCERVTTIIKERYGVVDKFTGDGVLAFFPEFYSGPSAGYLAIDAAVECHSAFDEIYRKSRSHFSSVLLDVGFGIGIDYGAAHLARIAGSLTVVGSPVVYACRFGGAPVGKTYLNQPAYDHVREKSPTAFKFQEERIEVKHEGWHLAYSVERANEITSFRYTEDSVRPPWTNPPMAKKSDCDQPKDVG